MKVLLMNQPWICNEKEYGLRSGVRWAMIRKRDRTMPYYSFPFPLAYATSYLRANGIDAVLRDSIALEESKEDALRFIEQNGFELVVLETATASIGNDLAFCREIKSRMPGVVVCFTGQHSTALPEEVLQGSPADFVLIGEYEKTLLMLISTLREKESCEYILGIAYRKGDAVVNNGRAKLIAFDELPPPYRDKKLIGKYNEPAARSFPNLPMMTSRGCSFKCTFCVEAVANYGPKSTFRYRSMDKVVREIKSLIDGHGIREIFFDDAFFTTQRARDISQAIIDNRIPISWSCWIDRTTDEETLRLMKSSGCSGVKFGVETFDESIGYAAKKRVAPKLVHQLVERCHRIGLLTHATYVFGLPGETPQTIDRTIQTAMQLATSSNQFSIATPLPGTEFFDQAQANGWLSTLDWSKYEGQSSAVLKYGLLTPSDLERAMIRVRKMKMLQLLKNPKLFILFVRKMIRMMGFRRFVGDLIGKTFFMVRG